LRDCHIGDLSPNNANKAPVVSGPRLARPLAGKIGKGPRHIGSKTAENRQKSKIFAPPPTSWLTLARAMFLANIYVKNDMGC
jgi:hypothetical protein